MKLIIDIDDNLYTRLFDKGNEYVADMRRACVAIRKGTPLDDLKAELHATAEMHDDGDCYLRDEWIDEYFDKYREGSDTDG